MNTQHTPGEWFVRKLERYGDMIDCFVAAPAYTGNEKTLPYNDEILGDDNYTLDETFDRKLADCYLISAAPNMLEVLKQILEYAEDNPIQLALLKQVKSAVDKALNKKEEQ